MSITDFGDGNDFKNAYFHKQLNMRVSHNLQVLDNHEQNTRDALNSVMLLEDKKYTSAKFMTPLSVFPTLPCARNYKPLWPIIARGLWNVLKRMSLNWK